MRLRNIEIYIRNSLWFLFCIFLNISFLFPAYSNQIDNAKKLNFKESGPFYGVKKNGKKFRGIFLGTKMDSGQSDWYGTFDKNGSYWKGYFKHTYPDGEILYQYTEYEVDSKGIVIREGKSFKIVDQYLISKENFEKVKEYIFYDIDLPFKFFTFDVKEPAKTNNESKILVSNNDFKNIEDIKKSLEIDGSPFTTSLENLETGEKKYYCFN